MLSKEQIKEFVKEFEETYLNKEVRRKKKKLKDTLMK